jgi:fructose-bisphosphate aldolase class II
MPIASNAEVQEILENAVKNKHSLPSFNVHDLAGFKATLQGLKEAKSDGYIQISTSGAEAFSKDIGKGALIWARMAHDMAEEYPIRVILQTDHCPPDKLKTFLDPILNEEDARGQRGEKSLFNSLMLDASTEPMDVNNKLVRHYLKRCHKNNMGLEAEYGTVGVAGQSSEEGKSGSHGSKVHNPYCDPKDFLTIYENVKDLPGNLTVAATFGNEHGLSGAGEAKPVLKPEILGEGQKLIEDKYGADKRLKLVFHGGSGSSLEQIHEAIDHGTVKMNVDTETWNALQTGRNEYRKAHVADYDSVPMTKKAHPRAENGAAIPYMQSKVVEICENLRSAGQSMNDVFEARAAAEGKHARLVSNRTASQSTRVAG